MPKFMENDKAPALSRLCLSNIIEGFVRFPPCNRIYYARRRNGKCETYPVYSDGTVSDVQSNHVPQSRVESLNPADLGIAAGAIRLTSID